MAMKPALVLRNRVKSFGTQGILNEISLDVAPGEFIALVGPSGCGKSTLLKVVAGLERADAGDVMLDGADVTEMRAADRDMAMVFQSYALYPHLTVRQNIALPLAMRRLNGFERLPLIGALKASTRAKRTAIMRDVERTAEALRITELLDRKPAEMSGGQRQRVALGRAVVRRPKAFLMDEPLSNLDAALRVRMRAEIVSLHREAGVVTLYVTHDQEEALGMADRVAVMIGGKILQIATPEAIYHDPNHMDVAGFIGSPKINFLPGSITHNGGVTHAGRLLKSGLNGPERKVTLGIRPEHLRLHTDASQHAIPLHLNRLEFLGSEVIAHLTDPSDGSRLIARLQPDEVRDLTHQSVLYASASSVHVLVFESDGTRVQMSAFAQQETASHAA
jgi:multiple sugar transport system ATP-binding protein